MSTLPGPMTVARRAFACVALLLIARGRSASLTHHGALLAGRRYHGHRFGQDDDCSWNKADGRLSREMSLPH